MSDLLDELRARLLHLPINVEGHGRAILLAGFFLLLLLIFYIGYSSRQSIQQLDEDIAVLHQKEAQHLRLVLEIDEVAGKMTPEVRTALATKDNTLLHFPAVQRLDNLKSDIEGLIRAGRKSDLADTSQWKDFEASFAEFWKAVSGKEGPAPDWEGKRERLGRTISALDVFTHQERDENHRQARELTSKARRGIGLETGGVLAVGLVVAGLTFWQINDTLGRLARAYRVSADSRDQLRSILDSIVSGVLVVGQDGAVRTVNSSLLKLTGYRGEDPVGKSYEELLGQTGLIEPMAERLATPSAEDRYFGRVEMASGRLFDVFASPLELAGQSQGLILVFVDMTEIERVQRELRRNRALSAVGQMTAQIAHEIKNPLGSIGFAAELMKRRASGLSEDDLEIISVIERNVKHLKSIAAELLEFSRPKVLNRSEVQLSTLLDDLLPLVSDRLESKSIVVERRYSQELQPGHYDESELRKLFLNLVINAIDASDPGSAIELATYRDGAGMVKVDVVDHGGGMDAETRRRLFEPFYTTKSTGTGLGMAIAKQIAELHRGDVSVASELGKGTTITVRLPVDYVEAQTTQ
jgi:two-component system, sporulation sensor kinase E